MPELGVKTTHHATCRTAYHIAPSLAIQGFEGITARGLFAGFPALRRVLRRAHLWAPSFYAGTAGNVSAGTTRRNLERRERLSMWR